MGQKDHFAEILSYILFKKKVPNTSIESAEISEAYLPVLLVLDRADLMFVIDDGETDLLCTLQIIQRYLHRNKEAVLSLAFITDRPQDLVHSWRGFAPAVCIDFPSYGMDELSLILNADWEEFPLKTEPEDIMEKKAYISLINNVVQVIRSSTVDLRELRRVVQLLFPEFKAVFVNSSTDAFSKIKGKLNEVASNIFMPFYTFEETKPKLKSGAMPLPLMCKYLLVACYMASYNPQSTDVLYFTSKKITKKRKKRRQTLQGEEDSADTGPKWFPLERALNILISILALDYGDYTFAQQSGNVQLFSQLSTLKRLGLVKGRVSSHSSGEDLSNLFFICYADFSVIQRVSQDINFPVSKYLHKRV